MDGIIGRDDELALGDAFLGSARSTSGVLLLEGPPGIGKTTVFRAITDRARAGGYRVLTCRPAQIETKLALSGVCDLVEDVGEAAFARLPGAQRHALEVAFGRAVPDGDGPQPLAIAAAVRSLLEDLAGRAPLLVAVDDAHWLDPTSAGVLSYALRRSPARALAWLLVRRAGAPGGLEPAGLPSGKLWIHGTLGPLPPDALAAVLRSRADVTLPPGAVARIHGATGGNPLHALEVVRALDGLPLAGAAAIPVPGELRALHAARILRLPEATREVLLEVAALSEPTTALVGIGPLGPAEEDGLISVDGRGRITFDHPLLAATVYGLASTARRREVHRLLARRVSDQEEQARHLGLGADGPDEAVAQRLAEAAGLARVRGAWASAAELLRRAAELTPAELGDRGGRRLLDAAVHSRHAGDRAQARRLLGELIADGTPAPLEAAATARLAEISFHDDSADEARDLYHRALELTCDARLVAEIHLGLAYVESNAMNWELAGVHALKALESAEAAGEDGVHAAGLAYRAMMEFLCGRGVDWDAVDRAVRLEDPTAIVPAQTRPTVIRAFLLIYALHDAEGDRALASLVSEARERGDESDLAFLLLWLSWHRTRTGHLDDALALAEEAVQAARSNGDPNTETWAETQRAYVLAHRGDTKDEVRRITTAALEAVERHGNDLPRLWIGAALALFELGLGRPHAALAACEPLVAALEGGGIIEPVTAFYLPDALEAMIAAGQADRALRLAAQLEGRGATLDRAWAGATGARCRGLALAAQGDLVGARQALDRALAEHKRIDLPLERARTLLALGDLERRTRRRGRARADLETAAAELERLGAGSFARRARGELARLDTERLAGDVLTPAERRVAERAASGLTNREVAAELVISPKTVEATLARVYRKLKIRSRAELGAWLARGGGM